MVLGLHFRIGGEGAGGAGIILDSKRETADFEFDLSR